MNTKALGEMIGINWDKVKYTPEDLAEGMKVETEHGKLDPQTNVTDDCPVKTAKIALAHLNESPDYYKELAKMESRMKKSSSYYHQVEQNVLLGRGQIDNRTEAERFKSMFGGDSSRSIRATEEKTRWVPKTKTRWFDDL